MNKKLMVMENVSFVPSLLCNLNCRLCAARAPYLSDPKTDSIEDLKEYTKIFFDIVDYVKRFSISGGEPTLYKALPEYVEYLSNFKDKIGEAVIFINGTNVPSNDLINAIKKLNHNFFFMVDNYGENLSKKIKEIAAVLDDAKIDYDIRDYCSKDMHCGGWVDYGDPAIEKHTAKGAVELYAKCACPQKLRFSFCVSSGIMTPCDPVHNRMELGLWVEPSEYIDLMDKSMTIEEQQKKINNIYNANVLPSCRYCNGLCDDSPRFKPAEQLTLEEIRNIRRKKDI